MRRPLPPLVPMAAHSGPHFCILHAWKVEAELRFLGVPGLVTLEVKQEWKENPSRSERWSGNFLELTFEGENPFQLLSLRQKGLNPDEATDTSEKRENPTSLTSSIGDGDNILDKIAAVRGTSGNSSQSVESEMTGLSEQDEFSVEREDARPTTLSSPFPRGLTTRTSPSTRLFLGAGSWGLSTALFTPGTTSSTSIRMDMKRSSRME